MIKHSYDDPIIEYWTANDEDLELPPGQTNAKRKWSGVIILVDHNGEGIEYEVSVDRKLRLLDYLAVLIEKLSAAATSDLKECGFKVW